MVAKVSQGEPRGNQAGPSGQKLLRERNLWTDPKVVWKTRKTRKRMVTATPKKITVTVAPSLPTDKV